MTLSMMLLVTESCHAECLTAECYYAKCRGALYNF
jgi:hypothetical protein